MADFGYIKISRKMFDGHDQLWAEQREFSRAEAWLDLIQRAAWKRHTLAVGNRSHELRRGEFLASRRYLSFAWRWSEKKVRGFIDHLHDLGRVAPMRRTPDGQIYLIVGYEEYQAPIGQKGQGKGQGGAAETLDEPHTRGQGKGQAEGEDAEQSDSGDLRGQGGARVGPGPRARARARDRGADKAIPAARGQGQGQDNLSGRLDEGPKEEGREGRERDIQPPVQPSNYGREGFEREGGQQHDHPALGMLWPDVERLLYAPWWHGGNSPVTLPGGKAVEFGLERLLLNDLLHSAASPELVVWAIANASKVFNWSGDERHTLYWLKEAENLSNAEGQYHKAGTVDAIAGAAATKTMPPEHGATNARQAELRAQLEVVRRAGSLAPTEPDDPLTARERP